MVMLEANSVSTYDFYISILVNAVIFKFSCVEPDIVIHELLHTIGLWHEHMRADRDDYIRVLYKNIEPGMKSKFRKTM